MRYKKTIMSNPIGSLLITHYKLWRRLMLIMTTAINASILTLWEGSFDLDDPVPVTPGYYGLLLNILGGIHIFATLGVVITYFLLNPPRNPFGKRARAKVSFEILFTVLNAVTAASQLCRGSIDCSTRGRSFR